jgi:hypothetical protein
LVTSLILHGCRFGAWSESSLRTGTVVPEKPSICYDGEEPYFFVSYAHADIEDVYREMVWLTDAGFHLWYDDGIHVGTVWREAIADALAGAHAMLYFSTATATASENCRKEINFASDEGKTVIVVQLDDSVLPPALRFSLNDRQTLRRSDFSQADYRKRLLAGLADILPTTATGTLEDSHLRGVSAEVETSPQTEPDLAIVCNAIDDQSPLANQPGWISEFGRQVQLRVQQLSGDTIDMLVSPVSDDSDSTNALSSPPIALAKAMVAIVTPSFAKSDDCRKVLENFWQAAENSGGVLLGRRSRLIKVLKTPTQEMPPGLAALLAQVRDHEFYAESEPGYFHELGVRESDDDRRQYFERVYDVAIEIKQTFDEIKAQESSHEEAEVGEGKAVYLAESSSDVRQDVERVRRELTARGFEVLPDKPLPLVADDAEEAVREYLSRVDFAVHPVGSRYGVIPENSETSLVEIQNRLAAQLASTTGLRRLIWLVKGAEPDGEKQQAFTRTLREDSSVHEGAEVIEDNFDNVRAILLDRLTPEPAPTIEADTTHPRRIYLICEQADEDAAEPIEDFLFEQGFDVCLPDFEANESEAAEIHRQHLVDCDAVLVLYGAARSAWVDIKLRGVLKAKGYGREDDLNAQAVLVIPPFDRRKDRFRTHQAPVIRQQDQFRPELLTEFVTELRNS